MAEWPNRPTYHCSQVKEAEVKLLVGLPRQKAVGNDLQHTAAYGNQVGDGQLKEMLAQ